MKKLIVFALIAGLSLPALAQVSPYLEKGKSGLGIKVAGEQSYTLKGCTGSIGGSYKGVVDIEAFYYADQFDSEALGLISDKPTSSGFQATATWWVIRKQPVTNIGVDFGLVAGYQNFAFSNFRSLAFPANTIDYNGYSEGMIGFDSKININLTKNWYLMPGFSAMYNIGTDTQTINGVEDPETSTGLISNLSVSLYKRLTRGDALCFSLNQVSDTYNSGTVYQLGVGYVMALK